MLFSSLLFTLFSFCSWKYGKSSRILSLSAVSNLCSLSAFTIFLEQKFFLIYSQGAPWNLYIKNTEKLKAKLQKVTVNISQPIVKTVPQYLPIPPLTAPIKKGEGKSPKRCMKNMFTATA